MYTFDDTHKFCEGQVVCVYCILNKNCKELAKDLNIEWDHLKLYSLSKETANLTSFKKFLLIVSIEHSNLEEEQREKNKRLKPT